MAIVLEDAVLNALRTVQDPEKGQDVVSLGMISGLVVKDGNVGFSLEVSPERGHTAEPLRKAVEKAVFALDGVTSVTAVLTAHRSASTSSGHDRQQAASVKGAGLNDVAHIVAVASGKGGVGKSTTAANIALALQAEGARVGLLDADIYGPSMPRMMGVSGKPTTADGKILDPMIGHGVKLMSMGFLVDEETPMIWRGPMVMGAMQQMMKDVDWGSLDVLIVDMPPGTGDVQLTLAQTAPLAGAIIVSTPQDIALLDARKGLNMFRKVDVPVLGIIENMSYFQCPHCGERTEIFSHGGARDEATSLGIDFLGEIPLDIRIRQASDCGQPIIVTEPGSAYTGAYRDIASRILNRLNARSSGQRSAPKIVVQ
ncbi:MAG: Mrp/NBP35 family ATP-binding protein [Rhodospirillaceae bacterium]|nr:Mrp/NBP35 family ATP-binding protein [Rhodospirillaceae bacterium]